MPTQPLWNLSEPAVPRADAADLQPVWDAMVIGAGIAGTLAALRLQRDGLRVLLTDAGEPGHGVSGQATVKVTSGHGVLTAALARAHGMATAVAYQVAQDRGFTELQSLAEQAQEELGSDLRWDRVEHIVHAGTPMEASEVRMAANVAVRAASPVTACAGPAWNPSDTAWAWHNCALIDPAVLVRSLAALFALRGGTILIGEPTVKVARTGEMRTAQIGHRTFRASHVLVCTNTPMHDPDLHAFRQGYYRHYAIAVEAPEGVQAAYGVGPDRASIRPVRLEEGRPGAVVVDGEHRVGDRPDGDPWKNLQALAERAFGAGRVVARWSSQDAVAPDHLPFAGPTRRDPRVHVVTGLNAWGFTNSMVAADEIAACIVSGVESRSAWRATRAGVVGGMQELARDAGWVTRSAAGDTLGLLKGRPAIADLPIGEGRVVGNPLSPIAQCRTRDGQFHEVNARCTHAGCTVRWNDLEESWDCPCHGSRFAPDGTVRHGPAHKPLGQPERQP